MTQGAERTEDEKGRAEKLVGQTISGRYELLSLLGEGGMGAVFLAEHTLMRKKVALKVLHPDMMARDEVVKRFEREAVLAGNMNHPNVAGATDFGRTDEGGFFLVLEYIEGTSLRDTLVANGKSLPVPRALHITRQIADALVRAHELGIVHRDLKPENVMLVQRGSDPDFVKVLDFGIAKAPVELGPRTAAPGAVLTRAGAVFGTPEYMAPEQALGENVDARCDLYTLGVMLYEMLAGALPFEGAGDVVSLLAKQIAETPALPSVRAPAAGVPPGVDAIVMRLLEKNPADRFQTAADLVAALEANGAIAAAAASASLPNLPAAPPSSPWSSADAVAKTSLPQANAHVERKPTVVDGDAASPAPPPSAAAQTSPMASSVAGMLAALPAPVSEAYAKLPPPVRRLVPVGVVAIVGATFLIGVLLLGTVALRAIRGHGDGVVGEEAGAAEAIEAHASPKLSAEAIAQAAVSGPDALEELSKKFPSDARVLQELVKTYSSLGHHVDAMRAAQRLLVLEPRAAGSDDVVAAVTAAATATNPEAVDAAIALCEQKMGEKGVDVLYDLSKRPSPNPWRARINDSLMKPEVRAKASPSLQVTLDLRAAKTCEEKRDMLPRVRASGDVRTAAVVREMIKKRRCGFFSRGDCCIKKEELDDVLSVLDLASDGGDPKNL